MRVWVHTCTPTHPNPAQANSTQPKPTQPNSPQPNPIQPNPNPHNPTQPNPSQPNPTQPSPAQASATRPAPNPPPSKPNIRPRNRPENRSGSRLSWRPPDWSCEQLPFHQAASSVGQLFADARSAASKFFLRANSMATSERKGKQNISQRPCGLDERLNATNHVQTQQRAVQNGWPRTTPSVSNNLGFELHDSWGSIGTVSGLTHALGRV